MRVWLVNHYAVPPSEPGGIRHYALARQLLRSGHDVTVIASNINHATGRQIARTSRTRSTVAEHSGVPFLFLPVPGYSSNPARFVNMVAFAAELWARVGLSRLKKPDVIVGSSLTLFAAFSAERIARRLGVPFVLEIRDLWPQTLLDLGLSKTHPAVVAFGAVEKYLYRNADRIVTLLPNASEHMVPKGARLEDIVWIPNGIDTELMPRPIPPSDNACFTVLYAGSHAPGDALDTVLDAAALLETQSPGAFRFRIVGQGPAKAGLQQRAKDEGVRNVSFEDPVLKSEVFSLMQEADAFVISTKRTGLYRYGISPNKLHEYMAAARPTVMAVESFNDPITNSGGGITVKPEDPAAMAAALHSLASLSASERYSMGMKARAYVEEHHDFRVLARKLERVLTDVIAENGNTRKQDAAVQTSVAA